METSVNNKCKAFTSLEQSKKLAEILPHESSDFHFSANQSPQGYLEKPIWGNSEYADYSAFPCWSLATLLDISPYIEVGRELYGAHHGKWYSRYTTGDYQYKTIADNLIDACYEMILKLHEQKLI